MVAMSLSKINEFIQNVKIGESGTKEIDLDGQNQFCV